MSEKPKDPGLFYRLGDWYRRNDPDFWDDISNPTKSLSGSYKYLRRFYRKRTMSSLWNIGGIDLKRPQDLFSTAYGGLQSLDRNLRGVGFSVGNYRVNAYDLFMPVGYRPDQAFQDNPIRWIFGFTGSTTGKIMSPWKSRKGQYISGQIGQNIGYGIYDSWDPLYQWEFRRRKKIRRWSDRKLHGGATDPQSLQVGFGFGEQPDYGTRTYRVGRNWQKSFFDKAWEILGGAAQKKNPLIDKLTRESTHRNRPTMKPNTPW